MSMSPAETRDLRAESRVRVDHAAFVADLKNLYLIHIDQQVRRLLGASDAHGTARALSTRLRSAETCSAPVSD
jgi:hypothetical protein